MIDLKIDENREIYLLATSILLIVVGYYIRMPWWASINIGFWLQAIGIIGLASSIQLLSKQTWNLPEGVFVALIMGTALIISTAMLCSDRLVDAAVKVVHLLQELHSL